jgi:hypothetical protein
MRTALAAALLLGLAVAVPPAHADDFLCDFTGYDWTWPLPNVLDQPGQYYELNSTVGAVNPTFLNFNFGANEYTLVLGNNLWFNSSQTFGTIVVAHYINGSIDIFCDPRNTGTAATYNYNGDCDPFEDRLTFVDGDPVVLHGDFTSFDIVFDTTTGDGNLAGLTNWTGGSQLGNIPPSQRTGWTFGATGIRVGTTPCGYHWQVDGNCVLQEPVPSQNTTWGDLKSKFEIRR